MVGWVVEQDFHRNFLVHIITPLKLVTSKAGNALGTRLTSLLKKTGNWGRGEKHPRWRPPIHGEFEQFANNFLLLGN